MITRRTTIFSSIAAALGLTAPAAGFEAGTQPCELKTNSVGKFATFIGDGVKASFTLKHDLGTFDIVVSVYDAEDCFHEVWTGIAPVSKDEVAVHFAVPPRAMQYRVIVIG